MAKEEMTKGKSPKEVAEIMGVSQMETHVFICTGPDCCTEEQGKESWRALKAKIKQKFPNLSESKIYRTRVDCLRICKEGPIAVAYPQGKWFQNVTSDRVDELVEYLHAGSREPHPLEFKEHPLPADA